MMNGAMERKMVRMAGLYLRLLLDRPPPAPALPYTLQGQVVSRGDDVPWKAWLLFRDDADAWFSIDAGSGFGTPLEGEKA